MHNINNLDNGKITPALPFRGLHYDLARGNYDSLPSLRRLIRFMAECGLNQLVLYMEDLWRYRSHPALANPHAYEPAEIGDLAQYAVSYGIEVIPSLTTLGHSHSILDKPEYRHLAYPGKGADFDVDNPAVYDLFAALFDEVLPHFQSPYVFINGDEMNLSRLNDDAREQARREGLGALYGKGMARMARLVIERGRRPIAWHDMFLHHPEALDLLPRETIVSYWYYDSQPEFPALDFFREQGFDVLAAPSVLRHARLPDYARGLPNIGGQSRAAARAATRDSAVGEPGPTCLGTLLTIWECVPWSQVALGIYAAGRWANAPDTPQEQVLSEFANDTFGLDRPELGHAWKDGARDVGRLMLQNIDPDEDIGDAQRNLLEPQVEATRCRLRGFLAEAESGLPERNADIHQRMADAARMMAGYDDPGAPSAPPPHLHSPDLVGRGTIQCRIVTGQTRYGHELIVLTNGSLAVTILPQFAASMIEWVLLRDRPWSYIPSGYDAWAASCDLASDDPALESPWAAHRVGGWRECLFYNARLNPSSLWGRPYVIETIEESDERVTVLCRGENEVATVARTITLCRGSDRIAIETIATNKRASCFLAIQPNVPYEFAGTRTALLQLTQWDGAEQISRPLIDHDGTKLFVPRGDRLRIESPLTGQYLQLRTVPGQISQVLTDCSRYGFTLEPFGVPARCATGESVSLRLDYELGLARTT